MADGLTLRHPQTGATIFSATTVNSHSRALVTTSGGAGSTNVANLLRGVPFIIQALPSDGSPNYNLPDFTISGSNLTWNAAARHMRVLVGSFAGAAPATAPTMVSGLVVRNPATGAVQVSPLDVALQLHSYGAVVLERDLSPAPLPMVRGSITVTGVNPVVAFRVQDGHPAGITRVVANGGGSFTFHFQAQAASAVGLIYWVFDATAAALKLDTDCALVVRDNMGVKTFDSRAYALKVVALREQEATEFGGTQTISQPSGSTYAVIQSSIGWHSGMYDQGGYGPDEYPPPFPVIGEPQWPRPVGTRWAYMQLLSHMTTAQFSGSTITTGLTVFERWNAWSAADIQPSSEIYGRARHTIIDVTGLPSAVMPNPSAPVVTVSALERSVSLLASTPITTTTPSVSLSISGGQAPYAILWQRTAGSGLVGAAGATNAASFATRVPDQPLDTALVAEWSAEVTDSHGVVTRSDPVRFTHTLMRHDLVPDLIAPIASVSGESNNPDHVFGWEFRRITGITAPIWIRIERYSYGGDADVAELLGAYSVAGSSWANLGPVDARGAGYAYIDQWVNPGDYIGWKVRVSTARGRRWAGMQVVIWNRSDPSGPRIIADTPSNIMVVDADDNHNTTDAEPDYMAWSNQSASTNAEWWEIKPGGRYVFGINVPVTLRATLSNVSNDMSPAYLDIYKNGVHQHRSGVGEGYWVEASFNQGDLLEIVHAGYTPSGRKTASFDVTLSNRTLGMAISSYHVDGVVDADDDYNVVDAEPGGFGWDNQSLTVASGLWQVQPGGRYVIGINVPISITISLSSVSNSMTPAGVDLYRNGAFMGRTDVVNGGSVTASFNHGDVLEVVHWGLSPGGARSTSYWTSVHNATTGSGLAAYYVTGTINA